MHIKERKEKKNGKYWSMCECDRYRDAPGGREKERNTKPTTTGRATKEQIQKAQCRLLLGATIGAAVIFCDSVGKIVQGT